MDVSAIQTDTGFRRAAVTEASGLFVLDPPGGAVSARSHALRPPVVPADRIVLTVNANPEINITLSLGDLGDRGRPAAAPLVETRSPGIGSVIENERTEALPLNGPQPVALIALAGAAVPSRCSTPPAAACRAGRAIAVAGGQKLGTAYMLDGATPQQPVRHPNLPLPFPDALQEFARASSTTANNGVHSSASVNAVTKSGTCKFTATSSNRPQPQINAVNRFNSSVDKTTGALCPFCPINEAPG